MSILDMNAGGGEGGEGSTEGASVDALNQSFQDAGKNEGSQAGLHEGKDDQTATGKAPWYYDDNMPGQGDRPEWLKDKYKSAAEQAKAYNELDKKLGAFKGAPESYDTAIPDMPDFKFEEGDPMLSEFLDMAKKSNASQEFVTQALQQYVKTQMFFMPDPEQEFQKLGVNATTEVKQLTEWAGQRLDKNEMEVFKGLVTTAEAFRVIQKLRRATTSDTGVAVTATQQQAPQISERQLLEMIGDPRFNTDPLYRKEVEAKAQRIWG